MYGGRGDLARLPPGRATAPVLPSDAQRRRGACAHLLHLFGAKIRRDEAIIDTKVIRAWQQRLAGSARMAAQAGRELPLKPYQVLCRPTDFSIQFIRWLRSMLLRATCYREALALLRPLTEKYR